MRHLSTVTNDNRRQNYDGHKLSDRLKRKVPERAGG